ncbi:MAG: DUF1830 domain-containing protein [Cyanobacteria bacterium J06639_18]
MAQILDPIPPEQLEKILCCYVNATSKIQIARISNIANWYFERVVFPGQRLVFEAPLEGKLEIHTGMMASAILSDTINCERLVINEENNELKTDPKINSSSINKTEKLQTIKTKSRESKKPLNSLA